MTSRQTVPIPTEAEKRLRRVAARIKEVEDAKKKIARPSFFGTPRAAGQLLEQNPVYQVGRGIFRGGSAALGAFERNVSAPLRYFSPAFVTEPVDEQPATRRVGPFTPALSEERVFGYRQKEPVGRLPTFREAQEVGGGENGLRATVGSLAGPESLIPGIGFTPLPKAGARVASQAAREAAPAVRRLATEQAGVIRGQAARDVLEVDGRIKQLGEAIKAARKASAPTREIESELELMRQTRRDMFESILPPAEFTRLGQLEREIDEARTFLKATEEASEGPPPKFGTPERSEYDNARRLARESGQRVQSKAQRVHGARVKLRALEDEYRQITTLEPETAPVAMAPRTSVQTGLFGDRPAQGQMLTEFSGTGQQAPKLANEEALLAREANRPLPGQRAMFEPPEPPAVARAPQGEVIQAGVETLDVADELKKRLAALQATQNPLERSFLQQSINNLRTAQKRGRTQFTQPTTRPPGHDTVEVSGKTYYYPKEMTDSDLFGAIRRGEVVAPTTPPIPPSAPKVAQAAPEPKVSSTQSSSQPAAAQRAQAPAAQAVQQPPAQPPQAPPSSPAAGGVPPTKPPVLPTATGGGPPDDFAANIRLSKYPEDLRETIRQWAEANPEKVQEARRGVRSDEQVLEDAKALVEEMGGDFGQLQRKWKPGEAWNAEEVTAIRGVLRARTEDVLQAAKTVKTVDSTVNQTRFVAALEEHARVQEIVHGVTAEAGRALRAFRQEAFDAVRANDARRMEELLKRLGGREKTQDLADALANLDIANPVAVNNFIRSTMQPKAWDYITELYYNAILSGPKTHIINEISNIVTTLLSPVERGVSAGIEQGLARVQGRQVDRFFREVPADAFGAISGIKEGVQAASYTLRNGVSPIQASKWEFRPRAFKGKLGRVINAPSTALEAADGLNRSINYRAALNATIVRMANREGLKGDALVSRIADLKATPPVEILAEADRLAEYRLFRQEMGSWASSISSVRNTIPPLRFVMPFLRTPINLIKFGLERSPVGLANPKLWRNLASKSPEASDQISRVFIGSSVMAFFAWKFGEGRLTGPAPTGQAERDRFYREGKQPFAVRIGDRWIQWQRLEPVNTALSQLVAVMEAVEANDKDVAGKAASAAGSIATNLVHQSYVSGLAAFIDAISQPEDRLGYFLQRQASGFVPFSSALRTAAQVTDPTIRKPKTIAEAVQAGIPGLSQNVPAALTAFGEEAKRQSPAWSPIAVTKTQQTAVDAELGRLDVEVGFVGDSIKGEKLSRQEQYQYQQLAGQKSYELLATLVASPTYRKRGDKLKTTLLNKRVDLARDYARRIIVSSRQATPAPQATTQPSRLTPEMRERLQQLRSQTPVPAGAR